MTGALSAFRWERLTPLQRAEHDSDARGLEAAGILLKLREAVEKDEFVSRVKNALTIAEDAIFNWLDVRPDSGAGGGTGPATPPPPGPGPGRPVAETGGSAIRAAGSPDAGVLTTLGEFLREHRGQRVVVEWRAED